MAAFLSLRPNVSLSPAAVVLPANRRRFQSTVSFLSFPETLKIHGNHHRPVYEAADDDDGGKGFKCPECPADFESSDSRTRHIRIHHRPLYKLNIRCKRCNQYFSTKLKLLNHKCKLAQESEVQYMQRIKAEKQAKLLAQQQQKEEKRKMAKPADEAQLLAQGKAQKKKQASPKSKMPKPADDSQILAQDEAQQKVEAHPKSKT